MPRMLFTQFGRAPNSVDSLTTFLEDPGLSDDELAGEDLTHAHWVKLSRHDARLITLRETHALGMIFGFQYLHKPHRLFVKPWFWSCGISNLIASTLPC
jgi:hypothetical protein